MNRIQQCEEKFMELFGTTPVKNEGTDPEFMRILQRFIFGQVCYTGELDNRIRELITITVLSVNQTLPQLRSHVKACLHVGCTPVEIREVIYQCAPFIGFPKTLNAIAAMNEVFTAENISLPLENQETIPDEERYRAGLTIQEPLYGSEIREKYAYLPETFAEAVPRFLTEFCFGDFYTREGLDKKERELLIFVLLSALGSADLQVYSHAAGALKAGCTKEDLLASLLHAMPYMGFPRMLNALNSLRPLF